MKVTTRQLTAFPCVGCGANLLIHDKNRDVTCAYCETANKAPKRLIENLELGRKLPFDAEKDVQLALDEALEKHYLGFELAPKWVFLSGLSGAIFFSWVYHATATVPATSDYFIGALLGFFAIALPVGWTASMLETTGLGSAALRVRNALRAEPVECPSCGQPIMPQGMPGRFDCCMCKATVITTPELTIVDDGPRLERFRNLAMEKLEGVPWLDDRKGTRLQKLGLVGVALIVTVAFYLVLRL